ncbi:endoribonuclease Dicer2 [Dorcoceras hygrometricum]|uniref:Endoribonuclease Dicer2 n=1 Tax=Dorcoceras hygrometricum TaxID=472368 RepID=A0A2Z7CTE1_9LAMI|nr:endoribonuclease Dicer2 [Dorcoceras hygrometricum]
MRQPVAHRRVKPAVIVRQLAAASNGRRAPLCAKRRPTVGRTKRGKRAVIVRIIAQPIARDGGQRSDSELRIHARNCITDSACQNQLVVVSVQYGPFNPYIPIRSTTIGKSRVAIDPIAMRTSWRSNSDIASVTSIGYPRMSASGESSTTMNRLLHASGSHPIPPPTDPKIFPDSKLYRDILATVHRTLSSSIVDGRQLRLKGRGRVQFQEESEGQNEELQRSVPRCGRDRQVDWEVDELAALVDDMELVMAAEEQTMKAGRRSIQKIHKQSTTFIGCLSGLPCWHLCLAPTGITRTRLFSVDCGSLRQSGPRPDLRFLRQAALEALTRSAQTDSPRRTGRKQFSGDDRRRRRRRMGGGGGGGGGGVFEERRGRLVLGDTASRGPTTIVAPESQFRTCPTDHGKASSNIAP